MKDLFIITDGQRDHQVVLELVRTVTDQSFTAEFLAWGTRGPRLHRKSRLLSEGRGYTTRLLWHLKKAYNDGYIGLIATVDTDNTKPGSRLEELKAAREKDRADSINEGRPHIPCALGEANPHHEAWLLGAPNAIRTALELKPDTKLPKPSKIASPKEQLNSLFEESDVPFENPTEMLAAIATHVVPERCIDTKNTGFAEFKSDVEEHLEDLTP